MSDIAIKVENLGKLYRLGEVGTGTLSHDLNRWWARMRGKEDPFAKIGETNDRTAKGGSDYVWSLKDVNFEVKQGEVLGIIGRNGAGKSTLLKLLSKVTAPTTGRIKVKGRIASLLEVGTGFHPELTGRENIFLNGAILGMTKAEISSKFDEIVDFAGVERYIDTPVKRYSSGMYVRLAFAVAAFLEPEILIIDEVLAVGDAEFQKKCIGRMKDVSINDGRTVLFVSHHLPSIRSLCNTGILMENGSLKMYDTISNVLESYQYLNEIEVDGRRANLPKELHLYFERWFLSTKISNETEVHYCYSKDDVNFMIEVIVNNEVDKIEFGFIIRGGDDAIIIGINSRDNGRDFIKLSKGKHFISFKMKLPIKPGKYKLDLAIARNGKIVDHWISETNLKVLNPYETVLDDKWTGLLNQEFEFAVND